MPISSHTHHYRRDLPHLNRDGATYFVTFCTRNRRILEAPLRDTALHCCVHDHRRTYWLHCAVVMPDHVHMLLTPYAEFTLAKILNRVKGVSSHLMKRGRVWQHESFDRILRSDEDLGTVAEYICQNPVRAGVVACVEDYPWVWQSWVHDAAEVGGATYTHP